LSLYCRLSSLSTLSFSAPATPEIYTLSLHDALPILAWQEGELARLRVDVQLSVDADIAQMKGARPDVVVLATGSTPVDITVPSDGSVEIITAEQLFSRQTLPSAAVVYETVGELDGPILVDYLQKSGVDTCLATSRIHV